jgi:hypothetical protein
MWNQPTPSATQPLVADEALQCLLRQRPNDQDQRKKPTLQRIVAVLYSTSLGGERRQRALHPGFTDQVGINQPFYQRGVSAASF